MCRSKCRLDESVTHFSRCVCGVLFLRRTTDPVSALPTDDALSLPDVFAELAAFDVGGLTISFIFGFTVVEKLRPRAIEPRIRLRSSAFGLTGACCCVRCSLLPMMNELRGDSTSFGSNLSPAKKIWINDKIVKSDPYSV